VISPPQFPQLPHGFGGKFKSQKVDTARRFQLNGKTVNLANVLLPLHKSSANISNHFQNILVYIPLQQA